MEELLFSVPFILLILALLFIVFPIYVLARLHELRRDVDDLRHRVGAPPPLSLDLGYPARSTGFERAVSPQPRQPIVPPSAQFPAPAPAGAAPPPEPARPSVLPAFEQVPSIGEQLRNLVRPHGVEPAASQTSQAPKPSFQMPDLEAMLGANWLAKLGIAAIAVAAGFFLQYAFRNRWIGPTAQVGIGLGGAAVMIAAAQILLRKEKYRNYAQVLASGGIVVYFLSIYAAYAFYNPRVMGFYPAIGAMIVGAIAASALAMANNTEVVGVICLLGAFSAPVLIRESGPPSTDGLIRLYAYMAVLNLWVAGLTRFRPWHSLSVVAFASTWLLFFLAGPIRSNGWISEGFAASFLLLSCYLGGQALFAHKAERATEPDRPISDFERTGLGLIVGGCLAFGIASAITLSERDLLGLPDLALAGLVLAMLLAGLAVGLPTLGSLDRPLRLFFGYLSAAGLAIMMLGAFAPAEPPKPSQVPIAFGFAVFNYLLFLATALVMARREEGELPAITLAISNAVIHVFMISNVLRATMLWSAPAHVLWLPIAASLTLGALWLARTIKVDTTKLQMGIASAAMGLCGAALLMAIPAAGKPSGTWSTWTVSLVGLEFALISILWLGLGKRVAWPNFRADYAAPFVNAAVFFLIAALAIEMRQAGGFVILAGCAIVIAAYHAFVGAVVLRNGEKLLRLTYLGIGLTFATIAIPLQLKAGYLTIAWAAEAAILVWTGLKAKEQKVRWYGAILLTLACLKAAFVDLMNDPARFHLIFNTRMLTGASVVAAAYLSAWWLWRSREEITDAEKPLAWPIALAANILTLLFVSWDLWEWAGIRWHGTSEASARYLALGLFWPAYAMAAALVGLQLKHRPLRLFAMALLVVAVAKAALLDLTTRPEHIQLLANPRMLAGAAIIVAAYFTSWLYWRREGELSGQEKLLPAGLTVLANAFTLLFVSVDLWDYAGLRWKAGEASAQQLALSIFWTIYALIGVSVGIWKRLRPVRLFAMALLYASVIKVFAFDLHSLEQPYRIISFFTLGVILLLISLLYTRFEERMRGEAPSAEPEAESHENRAA